MAHSELRMASCAWRTNSSFVLLDNAQTAIFGSHQCVFSRVGCMLWTWNNGSCVSDLILLQCFMDNIAVFFSLGFQSRFNSLLVASRVPIHRWMWVESLYVEYNLFTLEANSLA